MSAPYKSKIFNFVNRKTIEWRDRWGETTRSLKIAAEWGVQILLYPVYLLVQTGRVIFRQLQQTPEKIALFLADQVKENSSAKSLQLPDSDQPIQELLKVLNSSVKSESEENPELPMIKSVATVLETRQLVLVTKDDLIVNSITETQQKQIENLIRWKIANYWRDRRLVDKLQKSPLSLPLINSHNAHILPPVKLFWQLMEWVQNSQLAITINLFQEASFITALTPINHSDHLNLETKLPPILVNLDQTIASLEEQTLPATIEWISPLQQSIQQRLETLPETSEAIFFKLKSLIYAAIDYFVKSENQPQSFNNIPNNSQLLNGKSALVLEKNPSPLLANHSISDPNLNHAQNDQFSEHFKIQTLIKAAIDYFFSKYAPSVANKNPQQTPLLSTPLELKISPITPQNFTPIAPNSLPENIVIEADPWLEISDIFDSKNNSNFPNYQETSISSPALPLVSPIPEQPKTSLWDSIKQFIPINNNPPSQDLTIVETPANLTISSEETSELDPEQDWLETEAKPMGYEKHLLEKLLQWLDEIMVWIEENFMRLWHWLKHK